MNIQHKYGVWKFKITIDKREYEVYDNDFATAIFRVIKYLDKTQDIKMNTPLDITIEKIERRK